MNTAAVMAALVIGLGLLLLGAIMYFGEDCKYGKYVMIAGGVHVLPFLTNMWIGILVG